MHAASGKWQWVWQRDVAPFFSSHSCLVLLFLVIKPSPSCCWVKQHFNSQIDLRDPPPLFFVFLFLWTCLLWPVECFMVSIISEKLVRLESLTVLWFFCLFKCFSWNAQLSLQSQSPSTLTISHSLAKGRFNRGLCVLASLSSCFDQDESGFLRSLVHSVALQEP